MCYGESLPDVGQPVVIVGGNCSITGFDADGEERFWTVSGDNVKSLTFYDFNRDGIDELVAGSDDFAIRVFKGEEIINDITEKSKVMNLSKICSDSFGYSLSNGAYGVYKFGKKMWKSK
jgi:Bardet-Biedl syndrome 2 protein